MKIIHILTLILAALGFGLVVNIAPWCFEFGGWLHQLGVHLATIGLSLAAAFAALALVKA